MNTLHQEELLIFNDDYNTFAHVIKTLVQTCEHTAEQAEQCAWIIHHKGQCCVKTGEMSKLQPMKVAICGAGIDARIL